MSIGKVNVLIADCDQEYCKSLKEYLQAQTDVNVVGTVFNGSEAIRIILSEKPDVVLIDVILPEIDGIGVLEKFRTSDACDKPKFIINSTFGNDKTVKIAYDMGAEYFIMKPTANEIVLERILGFNNSKGISLKPVQKVGRDTSKEGAGKKDLEIYVTKIMRTIGMPAHIKGYQYIREAIIMVIKDRGIIDRITKELYPKIAANYETTPSRVERAIRHIIEVAYERGNRQYLQKLFGCSASKKPTNSAFIAMIADELSLELKK